MTIERQSNDYQLLRDTLEKLWRNYGKTMERQLRRDHDLETHF